MGQLSWVIYLQNNIALNRSEKIRNTIVFLHFQYYSYTCGAKQNDSCNVKYEKLINFYSFERSLQNFRVETDIESSCNVQTQLEIDDLFNHSNLKF